MHTYTRGADMEGIGEVSVHADINRLTEPMMWTPRILSVLALLSSLTRPLASAAVWCGVVWCVCVCVCVCVYVRVHLAITSLLSSLQYQSQMMRKTGGFVTESALHELLRYATKYHEPVRTLYFSMTSCFLPTSIFWC